MARRNRNDNLPAVANSDPPQVDDRSLTGQIDGRPTYEEKQIARKARQDWLEQEAQKAKVMAANGQLESMHESTTYHFVETATDIDQYRAPAERGDKLQQDINDFADDQVAIAKRQFKANIDRGGKNVLDTAHRSVKPSPKQKSKFEEWFGGE